MISKGKSKGGIATLRSNTANVDPISSLTDSINILTYSVDKLNDTVGDMMDVAGNDGKKTSSRRRVRSTSNIKVNSHLLRTNSLSPDKDDPNKKKKNIPYNPLSDPESARQDYENVGIIIRNAFGGVKGLFERMTGSLDALVKDKDKKGGIGDNALAILGVGATAAAIVGLGVGIVNAIREGFERARGSEDRIDNRSARERAEAGGARVNGGTARALPTVTPEQQRENLQQMRDAEAADRAAAQPTTSPPIEVTPAPTPVPQGLANTNLINPSSFNNSDIISTPTPQEVNNKDDIANNFVITLSDAITKNITPIITKNDATPVEDNTPDVVPYYEDNSSLNLRDFETPTSGYAGTLAAGRAAAAVAPAIPAIPGAAAAGAAASAGLGAVASLGVPAIAAAIVTAMAAAPRSLNNNEAEELAQETARMTRLGLYPAPAPPDVSTAPNITAPDAPPIPAPPAAVASIAAPPSPPAVAGPIIAPLVSTPIAPPIPQAPPSTPTVVEAPAPAPAVPNITPFAAPAPAPPVVAPPINPPVPAITANPPTVRPEDDPVAIAQRAVSYAQAMARATGSAQTLPTPPAPIPPPTAPVPPPARQVIVVQPPSPPPFIPPQINMPRATGGANIGRGVGFAPTPFAPPSPTARTPSYPNRMF